MPAERTLVVETVLASRFATATVIKANYSSAYCEKDFNAWFSISFPLRGCFKYAYLKHDHFVDSNWLLIEKEQTEFRVTKFKEIDQDVTLSIQFTDEEQVAGLSAALSVPVHFQRRKLEQDMLVRSFLTKTQIRNTLLKEQQLIDIVNSVTISNESFKASTYNRHYLKQLMK